MADKIMYIPVISHKVIPIVNKNYWFKRLDTQLNETTNKNSIIS